MKTAEELGLKQEAYDALLIVRAGLVDGILTERFNMNHWDHRYDMSRGECGTAVCIGGWMSTILAREGESLLSLVTQDLNGTSFYDYDNFLLVKEKNATTKKELKCDANLYRLFYPAFPHDYEGSLTSYESLTVDDGIRAITTYLETGEASWPTLCIE